MGNSETNFAPTGSAHPERRFTPAQPAARSFSTTDTVTHCACCGRPMASDSIAAQTITKRITLSWCAECHAGQHYLNFGITAGEIRRA
jgi:hypothetical protein